MNLKILFHITVVSCHSGTSPSDVNNFVRHKEVNVLLLHVSARIGRPQKAWVVSVVS